MNFFSKLAHHFVGPKSPGRPVRNALDQRLPARFALFIAAVIVLVATTDSSAQFHETFDGNQPTWTRNESDCQIIERRWKQLRGLDVTDEKTNNTAERIQYRCGPGTRLLVSHPVTPAFVIPELRPSVRVRSGKRGIQLSVRIVLPHTPAPNGEGPMTTLLAGPSSKQTNRWEVLKFAPGNDLEQLLKTELWMLRGKFGSHVTVRDAYVDRIVLNLYTGSGDHSVEIDDLKLDGVVDASRVFDEVKKFGRSINLINDSNVKLVGGSSPIGINPNSNGPIAAGSAQQISGKQPSHIVRDGTVLLVRKRPFFPRIIQHNGESFDYLKAIGFNTIELKVAPSPAQLKQAADLDLWLVAPPPLSVGLSPIGFEYDRILAWSLGRDLSRRDVPTIQRTIRELRESDQRENRPTVGHASANWSNIASQTDILLVGLEPLGSSFIASQYSDWIERRSRSISTSKPVWADIQTELSEAIEQQAKAVFGQIPPAPIELQQIQFLTAEALSAGVRGLRFRSRSRLDQPDPVTRLRALTCQYNNRWLTQIEPWLAGGALMGEVPSPSTTNSEVKVTAVNTNRARLLLIQRPTHHEQYWAGDNPVRALSINDPDSVYTSRVYQLTDTDLKPLSVTRQPGGTKIEIPDCPSTATIVMTEDPMVINGLIQSLKQPGQQSMFEMHTEITRQWLAIMQLVDRQMARVGHRTPASSGSLNEAVNAFKTVAELTSRNSSTTALPYLDRTDERLAFSRREIQGEALNQFQSKSSTPLVAHCSLVPLHWQLAGQLQNSTSALNSLAGGDFENLELMKRSGWENNRDGESALQTNVELSQDAASDGQYGLKLTVARTGTAGVESIPLWVSSPKIRIRPNQLVRIHGWANVPRTITDGENGLMIVDTLGTRGLAERIPVTQGWQEFTLYRTADEEADLRIRFELNGIGTAMVDEVTVQVIDLTSMRRQANSTPGSRVGNRNIEQAK